MYSALLFVYSLYTEILVCIFKDFLCDIRHSELNHNNDQLENMSSCVSGFKLFNTLIILSKP